MGKKLITMIAVILGVVYGYKQYSLPNGYSANGFRWGIEAAEPYFLGPCWAKPVLKSEAVGQELVVTGSPFKKPVTAAKFCEKNPKCIAVGGDKRYKLYSEVTSYRRGMLTGSSWSWRLDRKCWSDLLKFGLGNPTPSLKSVTSMTTDDFIDQMKWGCCQGTGFIRAHGGKTEHQCLQECRKQSGCTAISWSGSEDKYCNLYRKCDSIELKCGNNGLPWRTFKRWTAWGDCVEDKFCTLKPIISDPDEKPSDVYEWLIPLGKPSRFVQVGAAGHVCTDSDRTSGDAHFFSDPRDTLEECQQLCKGISGCNGVSFHKNTGACDFFYKVSGSVKKTLTSSDLAYPNAWTCWKKEISGHGLKNADKACWGACGARSGPCSFCGTGKCCRKNFRGGEKGCAPEEGGSGHTCVSGDVTVPAENKSLAKCKELCAAHDKCTGVTSYHDQGGCLAWFKNACQEPNRSETGVKTCMYRRKGSPTRLCAAGNQYGKEFGGSWDGESVHMWGDLMPRLPNGFSLWQHCPPMKEGYTCDISKYKTWLQPAHRLVTEAECLDLCEKRAVKDSARRGNNGVCCSIIKPDNTANGYQCMLGEHRMKKVGFEADGFPLGVLKATICEKRLVPTSTCRAWVRRGDDHGNRYPSLGRRRALVDERRIRKKRLSRRQ